MKKIILRKLPYLGISIGDFNGIGIEIILKIFSKPEIYQICTPVIFAPPAAFYHYKDLFGFNSLRFHIIKNHEAIKPGVFNIIEDKTPVTISPGKPTHQSSRAAILSLDSSTLALKKGYIDVLITAPINKNAMQKEGFKYAGHTEYLAHHFGVKEGLMLMYSKKLAIATLTTHVPVSMVSRLINADLLTQKIDILHKTLKQNFKIENPHIAILGLNPHAGEKGSIGQEELDVINPTLQKLRNQKDYRLTDCLSADSFFGLHQYEKYDAVLSMYHDQGLIPFKTIALSEGVNYTAGLPIIRTSPAHGTAYNIAGQDKANPHSFKAAINLAIYLWKLKL